MFVEIGVASSHLECQGDDGQLEGGKRSSLDVLLQVWEVRRPMHNAHASSNTRFAWERVEGWKKKFGQTLRAGR